ncbi:MAG: cell division protein FtsZ [Flavobacteriales bacterium]|nr:cell division protein FtsZ [Flavobacteriales bacterium]MCB9205463.1 cell division protein FtsZ [Flavobacteriales bacterium]
MNFNLPKEESSIIKVIGVGGGGSNAVNHMYKQGIRGVDFVVCNTDQQALDMSPVPKKIALGSSLTEGRGAGAQAEVGRNAAIENLDDIREVLENNTKMVFITAGMGGGTGTGAAPIIAEAARELGILTVGIVTVPFTFEGKKRRLQAEKGLDELKKHVDTVLVISNDKLREMYGNLKLSEAFHQADDVLTIASKGIAEIITVEGYVNVDFEDVRTVMTNSGVAIMGSATTSGQDRAIKAVEQALASPLLNDNNIYGASNILLYISSGKDEVTMDEVAEITDYIQEEAGMDADVIWGNGTDEDMGDKLTLTIIATGFSGDKLEKVTGKENVVRHVLETNRQAPRTEPKTEAKTSIPSGLTARPQLLSERLKPAGDAESTEDNFATNETPSAAVEPVIKHTLTLDDEPEAKQEQSTIMAYKVDETDEEINAILEADAPELKGYTEDEELPMYNEDDEDFEEFAPMADLEPTMDEANEITALEEESFEMEETPDFTAETETEVEFNEEVEEETPTLMPFSLFKDPVQDEVEEEFVAENDPMEDDTDDNIITTETATEFEFELKNETPKAEQEVKKFDLYGPNVVGAKSEETMDELTNEPKLITRPESEPTPTASHSEIDTEEMQRKQQERMERLRNMNQRFRSPSNLAELENVPAFKRRNISLNDTPHSSESSVTRFEVKEDGDTDENGNPRGGLSDNNEFLHKSVD